MVSIVRSISTIIFYVIAVHNATKGKVVLARLK